MSPHHMSFQIAQLVTRIVTIQAFGELTFEVNQLMGSQSIPATEQFTTDATPEIGTRWFLLPFSWLSDFRPQNIWHENFRLFGMLAVMRLNVMVLQVGSLKEAFPAWT